MRPHALIVVKVEYTFEVRARSTPLRTGRLERWLSLVRNVTQIRRGRACGISLGASHERQ